jgi:hypothetical protein
VVTPAQMQTIIRRLPLPSVELTSSRPAGHGINAWGSQETMNRIRDFPLPGSIESA